MISADQKGDIHISDIYAKIGFIRFSKNPKITQPTITATGNSNLSGTCRFRDDSKKSIRCSFDSALRIEAGTSQRFDIFVNQEKGIEESPAGSSDITMIAPMSFTWGD